MIGFPIAQVREVNMCLRTDFMGLTHEVGNAAEAGAMYLSPERH